MSLSDKAIWDWDMALPPIRWGDGPKAGMRVTRARCPLGRRLGMRGAAEEKAFRWPVVRGNGFGVRMVRPPALCEPGPH